MFVVMVSITMVKVTLVMPEFAVGSRVVSPLVLLPAPLVPLPTPLPVPLPPPLVVGAIVRPRMRIAWAKAAAPLWEPAMEQISPQLLIPPVLMAFLIPTPLARLLLTLLAVEMFVTGLNPELMATAADLPILSTMGMMLLVEVIPSMAVDSVLVAHVEFPWMAMSPILLLLHMALLVVSILHPLVLMLLTVVVLPPVPKTIMQALSELPVRQVMILPVDPSTAMSVPTLPQPARWRVVTSPCSPTRFSMQLMELEHRAA